MKVMLKLLILFSVIFLFAGCSGENGKASEDNLSFGTVPMHLCGIVEYNGKSYYSVIDKTENGFKVSFSGEGNLGGYSFFCKNGKWFISYGDKELPFDMPYKCSLVYDIYLFTYLTNDDFVSLSKGIYCYEKENTRIELRFDKDDNLVSIESERMKFIPEVKQEK